VRDVLDLLIRSGNVVDGTGAPGRVADVGIRDGRIVSVGSLDEPSGEVLDADGLVVAPGFVDLHTHYDAQLFWDPTASPSPLHGVTTVFGGNCGFSLAPAGDEHATYLARLMSRVEGIPLPALEAGLDWNWSSFADWSARLDGATAVNAGFLAGHSALRRAVMGDDAVGQPASSTQIHAMTDALRVALAAGAMGFSTSRAPTHHDGDGNPVPSRAATDEEILSLCRVVRDFPGTQLEAIVPGCINGFDEDEMGLLASMSAGAGRPLNWNVLGVGDTESYKHQLLASDRAAGRGGRVVALTLPQGIKLRLTFLSGMILDALPGWSDLFGLPVPERLAALHDPAVRQRLDEGAKSPDAGIIGALARWRHLRIVETFTPETAPYENRTVGEVAAETGKNEFDALLDIVVADELRTGLAPGMPPESDEVWAERAKVWRDPRTVVGGSDAGAHLDMMCGATYSTFLVGEAVRDRGLLTLEEAVRQLTTVPASLYGVRDRGRLAPGAWADVVIFDPATVGPRPERTRADLPGGAARLVAEADGVRAVLVNGVVIVDDGRFTGATPGRFLRSGTDTQTVDPAGHPIAGSPPPTS
jgi:N-acyl-D-aspartate/D-glutamate deacylase